MTIRLREQTSGDELVLATPHVVVVGYTGRDVAAVEHHIEELARIGVSRPESVPAYFAMPSGVLTTNAQLTVEGTRTSGEVEPVYLRHKGTWFLGVGSDHTNRERETVSILESKACCPKPIGADIVAVGADPDALDAGFDDIAATCSLDARTYQTGSLAAVRRPSDILSGVLARHDPGPDHDLVVFGGTIPIDDGEFRHGRSWRMSLTGAFGRLDLAYDITTTEESP